MRPLVGFAVPLRLLGLVVLVASVTVAAGGRAGATEATDETVPTGAQGLATRQIVIENRPTEERAVPLLLDELAPATVLRITAVGFDDLATGRITQCEELTGERCANLLPVRFDERGDAVFQYLITSDAVDGGGGCRLAGSRCSIVLVVGDDVAVIDTVFLDKAPPLGTIAVKPDRDLEPGERVTINATGFPPSSSLLVVACASPATSGPRCGAPGIEVELLTDAAGDAEAVVTLDVEAVGVDRVACDRRTRCLLSVLSDDVGVRSRPIALDITAAPGAAYDSSRVFAGLGVALAALGVATWLITRTDWSPALESAASLIDDAEYADLDREADEFVEEPRPPFATTARPSRGPRPQ